jgi:hypothetical protein
MACWWPQWHPRRPTSEVATRDEVIYPGELPVGLSTLLSYGPHSLSATHCWPGVEPPYVLPFQSHAGPQQKVHRAVKEICHPGQPPWGYMLQS